MVTEYWGHTLLPPICLPLVLGRCPLQSLPRDVAIAIDILVTLRERVIGCRRKMRVELILLLTSFLLVATVNCFLL